MAGAATFLARPVSLLFGKKLSIELDKVPNLKEIGGQITISLMHEDLLFIRDSEKTIRIFNAHCTHKGCLVKYSAKDNRIKCPCHGSQYDLNGNVLKGPAPRPLQARAGEIDDNQIIVELPDQRSGYSGRWMVAGFAETVCGLESRFSGGSMKILVSAAVALVSFVTGGLIFIYSGVFDMAANHPHSDLTLWVIDKTVTQSVKHRSRGVSPPNLSNPAMIKSGAYHFQQMCVQCHGGPGVERSDAGDGLYPQGPDLAGAHNRWTPGDIFRITRNGLKMTGMPAWGKTTSDEDIWAMVAFMERLSAISPEKYQQMLSDAETDKSGEPDSNKS